MNLIQISDQHFNSNKTKDHRQSILQIVEEFHQAGNGKEERTQT